jgi:hypothetical protein
MPPNLQCPHCQLRILDWHFEWCPDGALRLLFQEMAVTDCPQCGKLVSYRQAQISIPSTPRLPVLTRLVDKAAQWSVNNQHTLDHYLHTVPAGKSLSEKPRRTISYYGKSEMQKGQVVFGFLLPPNQNATKAI